ncbi:MULTISPECIES: hypothetical protein [unclassified Leucobacter]|uniref:hypothetical protein n=1 Tax=unclassified Leucobacter TaxID=2621730 RepID=UPI00062284C8|nr:hypothetical protein [Leucobacter sp. Ag1]KKI19672.1 hypothetical protein XM48_09410 [Leucobacter sp. Ag1]
MVDLDRWAASIDGRLLDLDAAPRQQPYQCHDVWLSYLYALEGRPGDGYAPGTGFTDQVWRQFPVTEHVGSLFTRHDGKTIRRGDVVFWAAYDGSGLPHVAVALRDAGQYSVYCLTQNPGAVHREHLTRRGVLGVLRPITTSNPTPTPAPITRDEDDMFKPTVHFRTEGKPEWTLAHPGLGHEGAMETEGKVLVRDGYLATQDARIGAAWSRMYARGLGGETSRTDAAGYIAIQQQASLIAHQLTPLIAEIESDRVAP